MAGSLIHGDYVGDKVRTTKQHRPSRTVQDGGTVANTKSCLSRRFRNLAWDSFRGASSSSKVSHGRFFGGFLTVVAGTFGPVRMSGMSLIDLTLIQSLSRYGARGSVPLERVVGCVRKLHLDTGRFLLWDLIVGRRYVM